MKQSLKPAVPVATLLAFLSLSTKLTRLGYAVRNVLIAVIALPASAWFFMNQDWMRFHGYSQDVAWINTLGFALLAIFTCLVGLVCLGATALSCAQLVWLKIDPQGLAWPQYRR